MNEKKILKPGQISFEGTVSKTKQEFAQDSDLNVLMGKYTRYGIIPQGNGVGTFADVSNIPDYQTTLGLVREAEQSFGDLPSDTRRYFNNDPLELIEFIKDPNNRPMAEKLGIVNIPQPTPPLAVE